MAKQNAGKLKRGNLSVNSIKHYIMCVQLFLNFTSSLLQYRIPNFEV
jgi:hypothetical protein